MDEEYVMVRNQLVKRIPYICSREHLTENMGQDWETAECSVCAEPLRYIVVEDGLQTVYDTESNVNPLLACQKLFRIAAKAPVPSAKQNRNQLRLENRF